MMITDKHISKISNNDVKAFKCFFDIFYPSLCKFSFEFVLSHEKAADIAQETMIRFWNSRSEQHTIRQAKLFIYTVARNLCLNQLRHEKVADNYKNIYIQSESFFYNNLIEEEVYYLLSRAIDNLPFQTQNIIKSSLKGLNNNQIAEDLNISVNTVKSLKKSAYMKLRSALKKHIYYLLLLYIINL